MLGIIGGTGFQELVGVAAMGRQVIDTPYGKPSSELVQATISGKPSVFLSRHGTGPCTMPHQINYRANIYALYALGVTEVVALAAVGGIGSQYPTGVLAIPDQIIDYTWGREHTYADKTITLDKQLAGLGHIDFTQPYDKTLREKILACADVVGISLVNHGIYGVTQGPRLETAAEIDRMERDGVDMVGMTAMPEAALAKELGLAYATVAMVVNAAAGRSEEPITIERIMKVLESTTHEALRLLIACAGCD